MVRRGGFGYRLHEPNLKAHTLDKDSFQVVIIQRSIQGRAIFLCVTHGALNFVDKKLAKFSITF